MRGKPRTPHKSLRDYNNQSASECFSHAIKKAVCGQVVVKPQTAEEKVQSCC